MTNSNATDAMSPEADGGAPAEPTTQPATHSDAATEIARLTEELAVTQGRLEGALADVLRARAEQDNIRKRAQKDVEQAHRFALERFGSELLPVIDSMELGIVAAATTDDVAAMRQGLDLTLKMLQDAFHKGGLAAVDPTAGERFDPERHQAMGMDASAGLAAGSVVRVLQKGYALNDRLLRPALVIVAQ